MAAIGLNVPGGFGITPPRWFQDRLTQDIALVSSVKPDMEHNKTCCGAEWQQGGR